MVKPRLYIYNNNAYLASINNADIGSWFVINASIVHLNDQLHDFSFFIRHLFSLMCTVTYVTVIVVVLRPDVCFV